MNLRRNFHIAFPLLSYHTTNSTLSPLSHWASLSDVENGADRPLLTSEQRIIYLLRRGSPSRNESRTTKPVVFCHRQLRQAPYMDSVGMILLIVRGPPNIIPSTESADEDEDACWYPMSGKEAMPFGESYVSCGFESRNSRGWEAIEAIQTP